MKTHMRNGLAMDDAPGVGYAIEQGTSADYAMLAAHHYRAPAPGPRVQTLRARDTLTGETIGVLTVSMPVLNAPWRAQAWPRTFAGLSRGASAVAVNRNLRTISRVIVEPRYRALGIARALIARYLECPLTRHTEAVAAMGRCCPIFTRAGMREVSLPRSRRDIAMGAALRALGVEAWELIDAERARGCISASGALRRAVRTWAAASRATRRHVEEGAENTVLTELAILACASLTARPRVYITD